jgi:hypothetical protein
MAMALTAAGTNVDTDNASGRLNCKVKNKGNLDMQMRTAEVSLRSGRKTTPCIFLVLDHPQEDHAYYITPPPFCSDWGGWATDGLTSVPRP